MEHNISICLESGKCATTMMTMPLVPALKEALLKSPENKHDCWLLSNGYSGRGGKHTRAEHNFEWIDTILLDVDNGKNEDPSTWDRDLLEKFKKEHEAYDYFLWQTASSTIDRPKFRVIILLDRKIPWLNEPKKYTKNAIKQMFAKWTDDNASWYFSPTRGKLDTVEHHLGKPFPASKIEWMMNSMKQLEEALKPSSAEEWDLEKNHKTYEPNPDGWRNLPSVKKCLEGLHVGERDNALCAACYAMDKNGYRNAIPQFLDEVVCDTAIKNKFKNRYR